MLKMVFQQPYSSLIKFLSFTGSIIRTLFECTIMNFFQLYELDVHLEDLREMVVQKCRFVP